MLESYLTSSLTGSRIAKRRSKSEATGYYLVVGKELLILPADRKGNLY